MNANMGHVLYVFRVLHFQDCGIAYDQKKSWQSEDPQRWNGGGGENILATSSAPAKQDKHISRFLGGPLKSPG